MRDLSSPDWFPVHIHFASGLISFVKMDRNAYRESVFLSGQHLALGSRSAYEIPLSEVEGAAQLFTAPAPCFIFHAAFCCSSLIARVLEMGAPDTLVLKEPYWLAQLSAVRGSHPGGEVMWTAQLNTAVKMLSRVYEPHQVAVIKANDLANGIADILSSTQSPVMFVTTTLERFLVSVLKYPVRREWSRNRLRTLSWLRQTLMPETSLDEIRFSSDAGCAALLWNLYDRVRLRLRAMCGPRLFDILDDELIEHRDMMIGKIVRHFGLSFPLPVSAVNDMMFHVYSKSFGVSYSPEQRQRDFVLDRKRLASEIDPAINAYEKRPHLSEYDRAQRSGGYIAMPQLAAASH